MEGSVPVADKAGSKECVRLTWSQPYILRLVFSAGICGLLFRYDTENKLVDVLAYYTTYFTDCLRYKKLLARMFPKMTIAKFLQQRSHKELRSAHVNYVKIITEAYSKLFFICKEQMAYFDIIWVNDLTILLESKQENIHILGCQTLAEFICGQVDSTYARSTESSGTQTVRFHSNMEWTIVDGGYISYGVPLVAHILGIAY